MRAKLIVLHWRAKSAKWEKMEERTCDAKESPKFITLIENEGRTRWKFNKATGRRVPFYGGSMYQYQYEVIP